jgi:hypothetical protein
MPCDACETLNARYRGAVNDLQSANAKLKITKLGTVPAAVARRAVHDSLRALIAAEAEIKAHKAAHVENFTAIPAKPTKPAHAVAV